MSQPSLLQWNKTPQALLSRKAELSKDGLAAWRPHRLILRNYWHFGCEEFHFAQGRLVLRGANATGKSTLLVSAITFVLDGEKRRERLDTFGGQGRGMAYYLVGLPDAKPESDFYHEDRTGYVALEFERQGEYLTIGQGLFTTRRRPDLQVDSWGFAISDGRRIGIDFDLFHENRIPLGRRELEEQIGAGGQVVTRASEYQALVNRLLFGFETPEEYTFLLSLLLQLRTPKLNKDTKPSDICEMLTQSLPPLPTHLLDQVTQIIDDIDSCIDTLNNTETRLQAVREIDERQANYFNQLAQKAAVGFLGAYRTLEEARNRHAHATSQLTSKEAQLAAALAELDANSSARKQADGELTALEQHEAFKHQKQVQLLEDDLSAAKATHARLQAAQATSRTHLQRVETKEAQLVAEWGEQHGAFHSVLDGMAVHIGELAWPLAIEQHQGLVQAFADTALSDAQDLTAFVPLAAAKGASQERVSQLQAILAALAQVAKAQQSHEAARSILDREEAALRQADEEAQRASNRLENTRNDAGDAVAAWAEGTLTWQPDADSVRSVRSRIAAYPREYSGTRALWEPVREAAQRFERRLQDDVSQRIVYRDERVKARDAIRAELAEWESKRDPEPPRRPSQVEARRLLAERAIPSLPLYAGCQFRDEIPDEVAARVEATLEAANLLDALIVPTGRIREAADLLDNAGLGDVWLAPQHESAASLHLGSVLLPVDDLSLVSEIERALAAVGYAHDPAALMAASNAEAAVALEIGNAAESIHDLALPLPSPNEAVTVAPGAWRSGPVVGRVDRQPDAKVRFVGEANRRRHRAEVIAALNAQLQEADEELFEAENAVDDARRQLERFRTEMHQLEELPSWTQLQDAATAVKQTETALTKRRQAVEDAASAAEAAYRRLAASRADYQASLDGCPEARGRNEEGIRTLIDGTREYITTLERLHREAKDLSRIAKQHAELMGEVHAARERLASDTQTAAAQQEIVAELQSRWEAARHLLSELGVSIEELHLRIGTLRTRMSELEERRSVLDRRAGELTSDVKTAERAVAESCESVAAAEHDASHYRSQLAQRLSAYPPLRPLAERFGSGVDEEPKVAQDLIKLRRTAEERVADAVDKSLNEAAGALAGSVAEHRSLLVEYHPELLDSAVTFRYTGTAIAPYALRSVLEGEHALHRRVLEEKESRLYEEIILRDVAREIRERIAMAQAWRDQVNGLLEVQRLSNGETLSIRWSPKEPDRVTGTDPRRLVELLRRDTETLTDDERAEVVEHFRRRVGDVRERYRRNSLGDQTFSDAMASELDYRTWFLFSLYSKLPGEDRRLLTDLRFTTRSGAEKSLAMFIPILSAVSARYDSAVPEAPRLVGIDEAFAGVDEQNVREMFRFLVQLNFSWVMTSEKLWGVGETLPACSTYELVKGESGVITPIWFLWDGRALSDALTDGDA